MDRYHLWFDLRPGFKDLDLASAIEAMLKHMKGRGAIESWELERRKLGFGPKDLGEWHVAVHVKDLAQLEAAFDEMTPRTGEMERLHVQVWSKVQNLRTALYRDFPDSNRIHPPAVVHGGDEVA
ncbi:MAG: hypothetical protein QOD77_979 [Thermoplasmata archaeon]|jgi:hypothetical protein|nr:hypothetical protein [Thermoplasmata archaeon]